MNGTVSYSVGIQFTFSNYPIPDAELGDESDLSSENKTDKLCFLLVVPQGKERSLKVNIKFIGA